MSNPPGATLDPRFASSHDETRSCGSQPAHISLTARRAPRPDRPPPQPTPMPAPAAGIPCWALDKRPSISAPREVLRVLLGVVRPLRGQLVLGEARVDGARLHAGVAVDALLGIDEQHLDLVVIGLVRRRVDAVDGAYLDAGVVLGPDAGFSDHVSHGGES